MSKKEDFVEPVAEPPPPLDDDEILLQVNLRLRLDEVTNIEAKALRAGARRAPTPSELCQLACRIYDSRRLREKMMSSDLLGEPAWDMLLALYCLPARGYIMTVSGLAYAASIPNTTGLRWERVLQADGMIERGPQGVDRRKQSVRLTPKGRSLMDRYLTRLFYVDTPVPPHPEAAGG